MSRSALITHTLVLVTLIIGYVVVTVTGHDGTGLLGIILGYLGGATASQATKTVAPSG